MLGVVECLAILYVEIRLSTSNRPAYANGSFGSVLHIVVDVGSDTVDLKWFQ